MNKADAANALARFTDALEERDQEIARLKEQVVLLDAQRAYASISLDQSTRLCREATMRMANAEQERDKARAALAEERERAQDLLDAGLALEAAFRALKVRRGA